MMRKVRAWWQQMQAFVLKHTLLCAAALALLCIGCGLFLGWENARIVPPNSHQVSVYTLEPHNRLRMLAGWDGPIYINIAQHGYVQPKDPAFFPLYPLLIRAAHFVLGSPLESALFISWLCLAGALYFYLKIIKELFGVHDNRDALRAALLFVLFPSGVFLLAAYSESLFAFATLAAMYFALRKRVWPAAVCAAAASATHINGLFVVLLVGMILYEQRARLYEIGASVVVGSLGALAYAGFLYKRYHSPLQFVKAQRANGWLHHTSYLHHLASTADLFNLLIVLLAVASVLYWWPRRKSFAVYSALYVLIPFVGGQFTGFNRYSLMIFPLQFMLYDRFRNAKTMYVFVVAFATMSWAYFLLAVTGGYIGG